MPEQLTRYTYCATVPTLVYATRVLASSPFLIVDCEGKNLGSTDGVLSLLCIGSANAEHIFVFDVLAIKSRNALAWFRLVLDLLADPSLKKIMWDCRNDFLEISATYGVALQGVLDLQLAEIESRASLRGEKDWKRVARLAAGGRRLPFPLMKENPELFLGVHCLQGMDACLREARLLTTGKDRTYIPSAYPPSSFVRGSPDSLFCSAGSRDAQDERFDRLGGTPAHATTPPVCSTRH